jgi:von Willebrand factor type A domain/EGF-like domain
MRYTSMFLNWFSIEIDLDYCSTNPCGNGALCQTAVDAYYCQCPSAYSGVNCQECEYQINWTIFILSIIKPQGYSFDAAVITVFLYTVIWIFFCSAVDVFFSENSNEANVTWYESCSNFVHCWSESWKLLSEMQSFSWYLDDNIFFFTSELAWSITNGGVVHIIDILFFSWLFAVCRVGTDVAIVVDVSGNPSPTNFQLEIDFVLDLIKSGLNLYSDISRLALVTYADTPVVQFYLNNYTDMASVLNAVKLYHSLVYHNVFQSSFTRIDMQTQLNVTTGRWRRHDFSDLNLTWACYMLAAAHEAQSVRIFVGPWATTSICSRSRIHQSALGQGYINLL